MVVEVDVDPHIYQHQRKDVLIRINPTTKTVYYEFRYKLTPDDYKYTFSATGVYNKLGYEITIDGYYQIYYSATLLNKGKMALSFYVCTDNPPQIPGMTIHPKASLMLQEAICHTKVVLEKEILEGAWYK